MYDHNEFAVSSEPTSFGAQDHGILLILPEFFNYKTEADIPKYIFNSGSRYHPAVKSLENSLILSHEAVKFCIVKELRKSELKLYEKQIFLAWTLVLTNYLLTVFSNIKLKHAPSKAIRVFTAGAIAVTHLITYFTIKSIDHIYTERQLDDFVARLSPQYALGGIMYYEKQKQKNLAIRAWLPDKSGERLYNRNGELITSIFFRRMSLRPHIETCTNIFNLHQAGLV